MKHLLNVAHQPWVTQMCIAGKIDAPCGIINCKDDFIYFKSFPVIVVAEICGPHHIVCWVGSKFDLGESLKAGWYSLWDLRLLFSSLLISFHSQTCDALISQFLQNI